jgi:hypothetical protein
MRSKVSRSNPSRRVLPGCALLAFCLFLPSILYAKSFTISGFIFTVGPDQVETLWPNARVTLHNVSTGNDFSTVSNDLGEYKFNGLLAGDYQITVTLAGFDLAVSKISLDETDNARLDFQLVPKKQNETVQVNAGAPGVDVTSSSGGTPELTQKSLKSVVRLSDDFQSALPLLPGVVRGPDGQIRIKGGFPNQASALVNTASIADPFTGQRALRLPAVAVQSIRVLSNPFSAEYGGFGSGVVEISTRGGTNEWKWLFEDPVPRPRWVDNRIHGIESATPHFTAAGPLIPEKLYLLQSVYFGYDETKVWSLPDPNNMRIEEKVNTYTQFDWDATPRHRLTAVLTVDPQNIDYANMDTFDPRAVTADYTQRGFFTSLGDRWILQNGGYVQSLFSAKRFDVQVFPAYSQSGEMILFPEQNSGSYFDQQSRRTRLFQWSQVLHLRPFVFLGRHLLSFSYSYARSLYSGQVSNLPVNVQRQDGTLAESISYLYSGSLASKAVKNDPAFFAQDNWQINSWLVLDFGLRASRDSLAAETIDVAPRAGFVFAPTHDNRTAIRGGVGLFYDKIPINVAVYPDLPAQTISRFTADGHTVLTGPQTFTHILATPNQSLRVPYSVGWSLQFDRELRRNLLFRFGYEQRQGFRQFYVSPFESQAAGSFLGLFNNGRQTYREFLWMLNWKALEHTSVSVSYVHSHAYGELNDYNQFFGNFPNPLIRQNQYGPLPHDAPNRILFWGVIELPKKLDFIPVLDAHAGFPYSKVGEDWNYIGQRDAAGRFPAFVDLDVKLQYPFDFKFRGHHIQFRAGVKVGNVLNHFNPRDVQQYAFSPAYGGFYNSVGRIYRIDGEFDL